MLRGETRVSHELNSADAKQATEDRLRIDAIALKAAADLQKVVDSRQRADQTLQQSQTLAAQLQQQQSGSQQACDEAARRVAAAEQKIANAKSAADAAQQAADAARPGGDAKASKQAQKLAAQAKDKQDLAIKSLADAKKASAVAAESLAKLIQDKADAARKATQAQADQKLATEQEAKAREDVRLADEARRSAAELERVLVDGARPRDCRLMIASPPILVEVVAAPFTLTLGAAKIDVKAGGSPADLRAAVKRDLGFDDDIRFEIQTPDGNGGLHFSEKQNSIAKGKNDATLAIQADANVPGGTFQCKLRARYRINNRDLTLEQPVEVTIAKADKKK